MCRPLWWTTKASTWSFIAEGGSATLAVQVKARMSDSKSLRLGTFLANVRSETMHPRPDLYVLFVAVDVVAGNFDVCWLVPSTDLAAKARRDSLGRYRFAASVKPDARDQWRPFRLSRAELSQELMRRLEA